MTLAITVVLTLAVCVLLGKVLKRMRVHYPLSGPDHLGEGVGSDRSLIPGTVRVPSRREGEGWLGGHGYPPGRPEPSDRRS